MADYNKLKMELEENGFLILRDVIPEPLFSKFRADIYNIFQLAALQEEDIFQTCARLDNNDKAQLFTISQIIERLESYFGLMAVFFDIGRNLLPHGTLVEFANTVLFGMPSDERLAYDWHQESNFIPIDNPVIHFHFPVFENATMLNGTMSVLKGSHKLGTIPYIKSKKASNAYTNLVPENIVEIKEKYGEEHFILGVGDVGIFHHDLVHRSNSNASTKTRFSGVCRVSSISKIPEKFSFSTDDF